MNPNNYENALTSVFRELNETEKKFAPDIIFLTGDSSLLSQSYIRVSVIGSRKVSQEGLSRTRKITRLLCERDIVVVSGLALGVDAKAHSTAIEANGKTIAVLGTPLSQIYPKQNTELYNRIASDHLLVSQFPEGYPGGRKNFPIRNRLMALISDATVIVEAQDGSGTEHQGWEALRLGRPLWILSSCFGQGFAWPEEFLKYGAQVLNDSDIETFFDGLGEPGAIQIEQYL